MEGRRTHVELFDVRPAGFLAIMAVVEVNLPRLDLYAQIFSLRLITLSGELVHDFSCGLVYDMFFGISGVPVKW